MEKEKTHDPDMEHERRTLEKAEEKPEFFACQYCGENTGNCKERFCSQECETRYYDEHAVYVKENGIDKPKENIAKEMTAKVIRMTDLILQLEAVEREAKLLTKMYEFINEIRQP